MKDLANYRISFFDEEGGFLGNLTPRVDLGPADAEGGRPPRPEAPFSDGTLHASTAGFAGDVVGGSLTRVAHVRMDAEGAVLDTLTHVPVGPASTLGIAFDGGSTYTSQPFGDAALAERTRDGSGLLILERPAVDEPGPNRFRLSRLDLSGDTVFSRAYPYSPVHIPRDTIEAEIDRLAGNVHGALGERTGTSLRFWRDRVAEAMYLPDHYPPVATLLPGRDGTAWLEMNPPPGPEAADWLVLSEDGEPLALVRVPEEFRLLSADRSGLLGVERDELDVEYIVRYRVDSG